MLPRPSPGEKVEVDMRHDLPGLGAAVDAHAIPALTETRTLPDCARGKETTPDDVDVHRRHGLDRVDVVFWQDQHVDRSLRVDVLEREHGVVLVLDVGGTLSGNDATEQAIDQSHLLTTCTVAAILSPRETTGRRR